MGKPIIKLVCPRCGLDARAKMDDSAYKFIIYTCPKCNSNVVLYDNKIDIISEGLLRKLTKKRKLRYCGDIVFSKDSPQSGPERTIEDVCGGIDSEKITDLKILLATEADFDKILAKL